MDSNQDEFGPAINRIMADIRQRENEIAERKRMVNALCEMGGRPIVFHDIEAQRQSVSAIKGDQFHGKPLQTVVKDFLLMRGDSSKGGLGAATVNEIYDALIAGGYQFDAKDADNSKRGLRISLTKNSGTFHQLPNKRYGLRAWYPTAATRGQNADARSTHDTAHAVSSRRTSDADSDHFDDADDAAEVQAADEGEAHASAALGSSSAVMAAR